MSITAKVRRRVCIYLMTRRNAHLLDRNRIASTIVDPLNRTGPGDVSNFVDMTSIAQGMQRRFAVGLTSFLCHLARRHRSSLTGTGGEEFSIMTNKQLFRATTAHTTHFSLLLTLLADDEVLLCHVLSTPCRHPHASARGRMTWPLSASTPALFARDATQCDHGLAPQTCNKS